MLELLLPYKVTLADSLWSEELAENMKITFGNKSYLPSSSGKNAEKWSWICIYIFEMHKGSLSGPLSILNSKTFYFNVFVIYCVSGCPTQHVGSLFTDQGSTHAPAGEVWSLNHWTTRKVLLLKEYWEIPPYIVGLSSPQENNKSSQYIWSISSVLNTYYLI